MLAPHCGIVAQTIGDAGAFKSDFHWRDPALALELKQPWHYPVAQGFRIDGVDINLGATLDNPAGVDTRHLIRMRHGMGTSTSGGL